MLRLFDFIFSLFGLLCLWPILLVLVIVGYFDTGSPIFLQTRVGRYKKPFTLIKLRTMSVGTVSVVTHEVDKANITKLGHFLRKTKLDELPQLINVVKGEMSLVGPRPGLFEQTDLITEREKLNVYNMRPGITGLAQINEIDMSTPALLAEWDNKMIQTITIKDYFYYIFATLTGSGSGDRVK